MSTVVIRQRGPVVIRTGENTADITRSKQQALDSVSEAAAYASIAAAFSGPLYGSIALGLAGTADQGEFAVDNGDGTASIYLDNAGTEVLRRTIPINPAAPGTAALLGKAGGGTIQDFIDASEKLTSSRTFYVRTDGNDSNNGLSNTSGGAFLTPQRAINAAYALDCNGFLVTIQIGDGTYNSGMMIFGKLTGAFDNGNQPLRIIGNEGSPGSVVINPTNADALRVGDKATVLVAGMTLRTTTSGNGITASAGAYIEHRNLVFGACASETIWTGPFANVRAIGPTNVTGGSGGFVHATKRSLVSFSDQTLTFTGTPAFSVYIFGINDASVHLDSATIVGTATGGITVHINGVLNVSSCTGKWTGGVEPFVATGGRIIAEDKMQLRTFYVRTDGNDTNSGFENNATHAFLTVQGAVNRLSRFPYDEAGYTNSVDPDAGWKIVVQGAAFAEDVNLRECRFFGVTIEGAGSSSTGVQSFSSKALNTVWNLRQMQIGASGKLAISASRGSEVTFENVKFAASSRHLFASQQGRVIATGNYEIAGGATEHILFTMGGQIDIKDRTVTLTGTPAFTTFAKGEQGSLLRADSATFTGSATGKRYDLRSNSIIEANGGGASFLPGNTAGSVSSGGQYV